MKNELDAQIVSLKAQLAVLEAQIRRHESKTYFADLYGLLRGEADSSEKEIDGALYHLPRMAPIDTRPRHSPRRLVS